MATLTPTARRRTRMPRAFKTVYVEVDLDDFDIEEIRDYLREEGAGVDDGYDGDCLTIAAADIDRITTLALCGQKEAAREILLELVSRAIGRPL